MAKGSMGGKRAAGGNSTPNMFTVDINGTQRTYRRGSDGKTVVDATGIPMNLPLTYDEVYKRAMTSISNGNGTLVKSYNTKDLKAYDKNQQKQRAITNQILNNAYVSDKTFVKGSRMSRIGNRAVRRGV